jgi:hypothetical protein
MSTSRWRGLASLVGDAVVHASHAVEKVQKRTADRPFAVLAHIPPLAEAARGVQVIHDVTLAGVHGTIRLITRAVEKTIDAALDVVDAAAPEAPDAKAAAEKPPGE